MLDVIQPLINQFMPFAQKRMGFAKPPRLFLRSDVGNADNPLGKTAYYDPNEQKIVLYVTGRHPKDVMRSLSHELVHHTQNLRGDFDNVQAMGDGYAQNDAHLREMEREAYEMGNLCFRDWEDSIKHTIYFEHLQKGDAKVMSTKDWKNKEIQGLLSEAWGFKMDLSSFKNEETHKKVLNENKDEIFAPNHYCVHHGGVYHNGSVQMAEAVKHNYNEKLGRVTHYDMKLSDGTILENVASEDIQITNASLAEAHGGKMPGKRDGDEKPDFLDLDKDGDKDESMKKAAKDKEGMDEGGCGAMPMGDETAMMVVDDQPDMYGGEPEMMGGDMGLEAKLDMILDKLSALMGAENEEDLEEIVDTDPGAEFVGRGKKEEEEEDLEEIVNTEGNPDEPDDDDKKEDEEKELDERRARGRKGPSTRTDDARLREAVRKALKASIKKG
jgi:hypothetical protein